MKPINLTPEQAVAESLAIFRQNFPHATIPEGYELVPFGEPQGLGCKYMSLDRESTYEWVWSFNEPDTKYTYRAASYIRPKNQSH